MTYILCDCIVTEVAVTEVILKIFILLWIIFDVSGILLFYKTMIYKNCTYIYFMQLNVVIRLIYGSV